MQASKQRIIASNVARAPSRLRDSLIYAARAQARSWILLCAWALGGCDPSPEQLPPARVVESSTAAPPAAHEEPEPDHGVMLACRVGLGATPEQDRGGVVEVVAAMLRARLYREGWSAVEITGYPTGRLEVAVGYAEERDVEALTAIVARPFLAFQIVREHFVVVSPPHVRHHDHHQGE